MQAKHLWIGTAVAVLIAILGMTASANETILRMSTTTSTENSGLLDVLLSEFTNDSGIRVKALIKGTGAALRDGRDGNVDILLVHAKGREEKFVNQGYGAYRLAVMHNDFVIIGPAADPVGIRGIGDAAAALRTIAAAKARFVSRGDDSGTHTKEQTLWKDSGLPLVTEKTDIIKEGKTQSVSFQHPEEPGEWYLSIGQGMGKTITYAEEKQAYALVDRGTYLKYKLGRRQGLDLEILCQGDPLLYNPYGVIPLNPRKFPHVKFQAADRFAKWLVSGKAQALIADYRIEGQQAFFPDAIADAR